MKVAELLDFLFGGEPQSVWIFDNAEEREITGDYNQIDEDDLLLAMPDGEIDLCAEGLAYAVVTDQLPADSASLIMTKGDETRLVYLLETPVDPDNVPKDWDLAVPIGVGWDTKPGSDQMYELADLTSFQSVEEQDQADDDTDTPVPLADADEAGDDAELDGDAQEPVDMLNDAEVFGVEPEGLEDFLVKPFTFMVGDVYPNDPRRNTRDGKWKKVEMSLINWLTGGDNFQGLTEHPVAKAKEGPSIVPAETFDGQRKDAAVKTMHMVGIDIDNGTPLDDVMVRLKKLGKLAFVYTTFSHKKTTMELAHDAVVSKMKLDGTPNRTQVQEFLRLHHKDRYDREFISEIEIVDDRKHTADGLKIVLKTPAIDKYRVFFPLAEAVELASIGTTLNEWKDVWGDAVCGVALNMLEADFDTASCDVNRLFYTPRHAEGNEWYSAIILGEPLRFEDIEPSSKKKYVNSRKATGDPFLAGDGGDGEGIQQYVMPKSGKSLNAWHSRVKDRFLIADVLETYCDDKLRKAGGEKAGTVHLECPFEHMHSTQGGTATMAMNPDANSEGYWTIFCRHDSCSGRHKLEFLQQMLEDEWFPEEVLFDDSFVLPPEDGAEDEPEEEDEELRPAAEEAMEFDKNSSDADINKFLKRHHRMGADTSTKNVLFEVLAKRTSLTKGDLKKMWKDLEVAKNARQAEEARADLENFDGYPVINQWGEDDMVEWAKKRIANKNADNPFLFHYMEGAARITQDAEGQYRIHLMSEKEFGAELNTFTTWQEHRINGDQTHVRNRLAPPPIVQQLYYDLDAVYPQLRALTKSPQFTADGELVVEPGYHDSGIYYQPVDYLDIPKVSPKPTDEELDEALRLIVEEVLGDFPLGGRTREQLVEECLNGDGVPAVTHVICMLLLFFCRDMIEGATPGHLVGKPMPGTGASLLTEVLSIIGYGDTVAATEMPEGKEELKKTITAFLMKGAPMIYFDNINHSIDSGGLAMALTTSRHEDRILGKTQMINSPVRCIWVFTGNNVQLSSEILRRCILIDLDAHMPEPETRRDWRHEEIRVWVRENRGKLVWACLTIIQNWIAQGSPKFKGDVLNSFEAWSYVMGGICEAAGIGGFLGNRDELKLMSASTTENDIIYLIEDWWECFGQKWVPARPTPDEEGTSNTSSLIGLTITQNIQLSGVRKTKDMSDELTYNPQHFETFLSKYNGRVFVLADGTEVKIEKSLKATKYGHEWRLTLNE